MGTLRQAFNTALANSRLHVICETCPMHQLHKLCEQVQGKRALVLCVIRGPGVVVNFLLKWWTALHDRYMAKVWCSAKFL